jgi:RHS repeat-associated protein
VVLAPTAATGLPVWLYRGYTGHEQLDQFGLGAPGLINMNGRLYDPALGRVLSADNYVQDPFNSQNYNRYSYVLNNPMAY